MIISQFTQEELSYLIKLLENRPWSEVNSIMYKLNAGKPEVPQPFVSSTTPNFTLYKEDK